MRNLINIILFFIFFKTAASKTLLFDTYGFYNYEKVYSLSGDRKYIVYSNHGVVLTDLGITGETDCHGVQDFEKPQEGDHHDGPAAAGLGDGLLFSKSGASSSEVWGW